MTKTHNMSSIDETINKMVQSLRYLVSTMETKMSSLTMQVDRCFDKIEELKGKLDECGNIFSEGSHKGEHIDEE